MYVRNGYDGDSETVNVLVTHTALKRWIATEMRWLQERSLRGSAVQSVALLQISAMRLWASSNKGPKVSVIIIIIIAVILLLPKATRTRYQWIASPMPLQIAPPRLSFRRPRFVLLTKLTGYAGTEHSLIEDSSSCHKPTISEKVEKRKIAQPINV